MARVHHRRALIAQAHDAVENRISTLRVNRHRRFVEEDKLRLVRNAARDIQPAKQTARQFLGAHFAVVLKPHEFDSFLHQLAAAGLVAHIQRAKAIDVFKHGELVEYGYLLRNHADAPLEVVTRRLHRLAEQLDVALVVDEKLQHAIDGRRFAAAVRAQKAENLAFADFEIEVIQRENVAIALYEVAYRNHRIRAPVFFHCMAFLFRGASPSCGERRAALLCPYHERKAARKPVTFVMTCHFPR